MTTAERTMNEILLDQLRNKAIRNTWKADRRLSRRLSRGSALLAVGYVLGIATAIGLLIGGW